MNLVVDYLRLRRAIGWLGAALPFVLLMLAGPQASISAYYYTEAHDVFVASLILIASLLAVYRGYDRWDRAWSEVAAASLAVVALVPTGGPAHYVHVGAALLFFGATVELCRRFTFGGYRVRTFRALGATIAACMVAALLGAPLILCESLAILAFGAAWLIKGKALELLA